MLYEVITAGKSTLLNVLGGMDYVTEGDILVNGSNIAKYNDKKLTEYRAKNVGFVFQFYNLIPSLTAAENVNMKYISCFGIIHSFYEYAVT